MKYNSFDIALHLSKGFIGAIAIGRAEAGPRALGNRSILSDARNISYKERINGIIKQRSAFQPLAPICLEEEFNNYFENINSEISLDYMLFAIKCKPIANKIIPAVVHADNTARVQVITAEKFPFLFDILTEYKKITGIGILINTSFNGKGEPIVNTPQQAYNAYKNLDLDFLVLDKYLITSIL